MKISLVGAGCGTAATLTEEGITALQSADVILGAARVVEGLPAFCLQNKEVVAAKPARIGPLLEGYRDDENIANIAIALSGDSGFYSGARFLKEIITDRLRDAEIEILPGISSVQMLAAKIGIPWQNWNLVSAHGTDCDPVYEVMKGRPTFFLTGGRYTVDVISRELAEAGLKDLRVTVGENLSYSYKGEMPEKETERPEEGMRKERIFVGTAGECAEMSFPDLAVMLADTYSMAEDGRPLIMAGRNPGIPDEEFIRGRVPMTKSEVRSVILSKMAISAGDVVWDIGAGTGSVSCEMAMQARSVWALERKEEAVDLILRNREKFARWNLRVVQGCAPEDLDRLPVPDKVFVGGSGGNLREIMRTIWKRNRDARICVSAVLLETLKEGLLLFEERNIDPDIVQITVNRSESVCGKHMMKAGNPVFILTGGGTGHQTAANDK